MFDNHKLKNIFIPRIRFYKSANGGNDLERFTEHKVRSAKEFSIYTTSTSKWVYFRFGKDANTGKNLNFVAWTSQLRTCEMDIADRIGLNVS